jgi:CBS domain-containing protein/anti-sigma regulatory factor (Ser/Thr protein kinase)
MKKKAKSKTISTKIQELAYEIKICEAMTKNIIVAFPHEPVSSIREKLKHNKISGLPVINEDKLVGMVSIEDFIKSLIQGKTDAKVEDIMTKKVEVLYQDEPLVHAINIFDKRSYGRFPVVDRETRKLTGIITKGDIMKCLLEKLQIEYHAGEIQKYRASHIFEDIISDKTSILLKYKVESGNIKSAGEKSSNLKLNLLRLGFPPDIVRRIAIATYEAEVNIILYSEGGEIIVSADKYKIKINAIDKGPGIPDIEKAMQPGFSTAPDWVRELGFGAGMGLPNIKTCSNVLKIESRSGIGTNLEFSFNLS